MNWKKLIVLATFSLIHQEAIANDWLALAGECAPSVHPKTMAAVVGVESSFNAYAIGVVGGKLEHQPSTKTEAIATAKALASDGYNFSMGAGQVNRHNLTRYGLDYETAFEPCANLRVGSQILTGCYERAKKRFSNDQKALQAAFSCYYSGNFSTGFKPDFKGQPSYVQKVLNKASASEQVPQVPAIQPTQVIQTASPPPNIDETHNLAASGAAYRVKVENHQRPSKAATYSVYSTSETDSVMVFR